MGFNPLVEEWLAIPIFLVTGFLPLISFILSANAIHYRQWFRSPRVYMPYFFHPEVFAWIKILVYLLISIAAFLVWREAFRFTIYPMMINNFSGDEPGETTFLVSMILYTIFWALSIAMGPVFFVIGIQMGWLGVSVLLNIVLLGTAAALTVLFWIVWIVPGIMMLVGTVFIGYALIINILFYMQDVNLVILMADPVRNMYDQYIYYQTQTQMTMESYYMSQYNNASGNINKPNNNGNGGGGGQTGGQTGGYVNAPYPYRDA